MSGAVIAPDSVREDVDGLLDRCLRRLGAALVGAVRPGAGLWDTVEDRPSAEDHYGQLSAALALLILRGEDENWREPLRAWLHTPPERRGHAPFNRFLLYLIEQSLPADEKDLRQRLAAELRACALRTNYPSNNWTLLANVCQLLEAGDAAQQKRCVDRLLRNLDRWTTGAGGFIDFPERGKRGATPIAYHHKALFLAAVASTRTGDVRLEAFLNRMLAWSAMTWDSTGYAGGLGRSTHALYGDACLLAALILLGYARDDRCQEPPAMLMRAMLGRWLDTARSDGLLSLNPASDDERRLGWDGYMRLSVYNAWTAAILAWARRQETNAKAPANPVRVQSDTQAGVQRLEGGEGLIVLLSTRGQPPQAFSLTEAELRYAGGVPFHVSLGQSVLCPPAVRIDQDTLRTQPVQAGWTPVFDCDGVLYALDDFERCEVREEDAGITVTLEGRPVSLLRAAPKGVWSRLVHSLDWRLLNGALGRRGALHRRSLACLQARLVLTIDRERAALKYRLLLSKEGSTRVRYLNPGGHALVNSHMPERRLSLRHGGESPVVRIPEDLIEVALPAAIGNALGSCLPPVQLNGELETGLELNWMSQELFSSSRSSSSR